MSQQDSDPDEIDMEQLSDEAVEEITNRVSRELESRDKERVSASLGMFSMRIDSHESLTETVEAFERIWEGRIEEMEQSKQDTLRNKLDEDNFVLFGGQ
ncbi:hypothetical protein [Halobaculum gomorrense]|uniref:Uncharacterized protein n=1 Tax=Halobaculum gomorrense TaxID=43928 RepID=A0A1M5S3V9_9EURY|nr:hypothetical protein [Halobaculum gomorrense]SHH33176.1 hypothetical protein SAMN05443636_2328 [Halobaculum gomorrense]